MKQTLGLDEVGRGSLAGPVVVAGVLVRPPAPVAPKTIIINDSKQMTKQQRLLANQWIKHNFLYAIHEVDATTIDNWGIVVAVKRAALQVWQKIQTKIDKAS